MEEKSSNTGKTVSFYVEKSDSLMDTETVGDTSIIYIKFQDMI